MNDNFDNQKEMLLSLRQEINLLRQQVDYLLRNEKPLGLLDLDVLMNRTHTVYDMLCSINLNGNDEEQDFDIDPDAISGLFGSLMQQEQQVNEQEEVPELENNEEIVENEPVEEVFEDEIPEKNQHDEEINLEENSVEEQQNQEEPSATVEFVIEAPTEEEKEKPEIFPVQDESVEDDPIEKGREEVSLSDEFGLFFRFDDLNNEQTEQLEKQPVQEEKIVHFVEEVPEEEILERDLVDGEHLVHDNPFVMPVVEDDQIAENHVAEEPFLIHQEGNSAYEPADEPKEELLFVPVSDSSEDSFIEPVDDSEEEIQEETESGLFQETGEEIIDEQVVVAEPVESLEKESLEPEGQQQPEEYEPVPFVNDFEREDAEYELDVPETLGEQLQHDDNSLAAKLQQKPINELRTAIGINDKFLFVNELFGGSMEKYNRSVENLDDMKTLNGTLIYLNELKVELQWNNSNVAYQKLLNLVHRKFND